ncbi:PIGW-like protein [Mya arenaria]|uniref:Phosphatidylinositol-glycan biosynthesis class W protein n=1 Tax=Mya arenaria TaxID=6604 RepID=A0ABY7FU96_MYAAR|nr:PIGW-like protein [Mya arenaria]
MHDMQLSVKILQWKWYHLSATSVESTGSGSMSAVYRSSDSYLRSSMLSVLMDFFLVILPVELMLTGLSDFGPHCLFAMVLSLWILINIQLSKPKIKKAKTNLAVSEIPMGNRRPFITYYRAYANLITAVSILAVDFKIYPRVFAKTETFGTSVMDVGVGGFLIANAIVSPEARGMVSSDSILSSIWKSIKSSLPLVVIGMVRVVAVKALGYQEVVTEYGVHWNFFFTLAAVKIGCTLLFCSISPRLWSIVGVLTIALYQHSLTYDGLKEYIIKGADGKGGRTDIIDANREGLFSCLGFFSIYIMGVQLGKIIMRKREKVIDWIKLCITLVVMSTAFLVMMYYCGKHVEKVSRRFANLAYLLWVVAFNSLLMLAFLMFDIALFILNHVTRLSRKQESPDGKDTAEVAPISEGYRTCDLISAISYNGLFYFMFANLLTGLVNMSMKTIYQSNVVAYLVVTFYMLILSVVSTLLYKRKLCLKFW